MASGISMKIFGRQKLIDNLKAAGKRGTLAMGAGLYLEGNNIMTDSKKEVPIDLGALKNSGYVTLPNIKNNDIMVEIGYGGAAKDYAVIIHERTDFRHPGGGKAKYLQDPLQKSKSGFAKNVSRFATRAFLSNNGAQKASNMPDKPQ